MQVLQINQDSTYYGLDRLATDLVPFYRRWHLHDALGSTRQTVQGGGTLNAGRYDPWGAPIDNPIAPFGFAGELQGDGGLVYLRARWYTPQQGVFTSRDPFAGWAERPYSQHYFQYGYSNPVRFTDPSGRCLLPDGTPCPQPGAEAVRCGQPGQPVCPSPDGTPTPTRVNPNNAGGAALGAGLTTSLFPPHPARIAIGVCLLVVGLALGAGAVAVQTRPQTEYIVAPMELLPAPQPATVTPLPLPGRPPTPTPVNARYFYRTIDRAPTNVKNYTLRSNEHGMSTFEGIDPQYVLRTLGKDRLIAIPQDDPVLRDLGLEWNRTVGTTGDAILDANHWELWSAVQSQHPTYVDWWNNTVAPALAAAASRWTVIKRL